MRLQATSGNAAVAEWLQNQRPAQPASALAPMASAATLAPPSKPEVASAPDVEKPAAGPRQAPMPAQAAPRPVVTPAAPPPAGPVPIPYPTTLEAAPVLEAPTTEGEIETAAAPPPAGASDEELEHLDSTIDQGQSTQAGAPAEGEGISAAPEAAAAPPAEATDVAEGEEKAPVRSAAESADDMPPALHAEAAPGPEPAAAALEPPEIPTPAEPQAAEGQAAPAQEDEALPAGEGDVKQSANADVEAMGAAGGSDDAAAAEAGGGGGGGGSPIPERPQPEVPNLSQQDPVHAMSAAAGLPPTQMVGAMSGVAAAGSHAVADERATLAKQPPRRTPSLAVEPTRAQPNGHAALSPSPSGGGSGWGMEAAGPDGEQLQQHKAQLDGTVGQTQVAGAREAAAPMGEDAIAPSEAPGNVEAEVSEAGVAGAPAAGPVAAAATPEDEAASIVAQQEKGPEIRAAAAEGTAALAQHRQEHSARIEEERANSEKQMDAVERQHSTQLSDERARAQSQVIEQRSQWTGQQREVADQSRTEAEGVTQQAAQTVVQERTQAQEQAAEAQRKGEAEAAEARKQADQQAAKEKQKSQSGGIFGAIGSAISAVGSAIAKGVTAIYEGAKALAKAAIDKAMQFASAVFEKARAAIAGVVNLAVSGLSAIGNRLTSAFNAIRDRFVGAIKAVVNAAREAANRIAHALVESVKATLNLYARALHAAASLLEKAFHAVVDKVKAVVQGAINLAKSALAAFGTFVVLIKDIAAGPGQWIRNLGAALMDGIRNHLWVAIKTAVSQWFNDKVESVLGMGRAVWNLLTRGGISMAKVGQMAWEAVKAAIPGVLIALLIEKLVSMIIPAAGAILAIIEGLQAAWGTIQRILAAIEKFVAFLLLVKLGNAGAAFATAVAAGAVAAIDFVSNWLLKRLRKPASAVGGRIRAIAQKIGEKLKLIGQAIKKGVKTAAGAVMRAVKAVGRGLKKGGSVLLSKMGRVGKALGSGYAKIKARIAKATEKLREKWRKWREKAKRTRLERATVAVERQLMRGIPGPLMSLRMAAIKLWYRLSEIHVTDQGDHALITLRVNPTQTIRAGIKVRPAHSGYAKVISVSTSGPLSSSSYRVIAKAVELFKMAVAFYLKQGVTDGPELGRKAGALAENLLIEWSLATGGVKDINVGAEFPSFGGVPLGPPHGKISSDVRYSRGRVILDFKLTEYKRQSQHNAFIKFAIKNGYTVVYVYGKI